MPLALVLPELHPVQLDRDEAGHLADDLARGGGGDGPGHLDLGAAVPALQQLGLGGAVAPHCQAHQGQHQHPQVHHRL